MSGSMDITINFVFKGGADVSHEEIAHELSKIRQNLHGHGVLLEGLRDQLKAFKEQFMSKISEFADKMQAHNDKVDAAIAGLQGDVQALNAKITELQNSAGAVTPADQALLDAIEQRGGAIAEKLDALDALTPPPAPPTP